jgi:hypothetical protein
LHDQYAAALPAARRCTVDAGEQCAQLVYSSFPFVECGLGCGRIYVNDASALSLLFTEALAAHCPLGAVCGLVCQPATGGVCIPTDGGSGICETVYATPLGRSAVQHSMY